MSYEELAQKHHAHRHRSALPNAREAETIAELDEDLFTPDAAEGMREIVKYARFVESVQELESGPGCEMCESNRIVLEKAWQVVANEFFDPKGKFSQAEWAKQLLSTLQAAGGVVRSKHQLYALAEHMVSTLDDQYSEFLPPSAFRRALRKPAPAERDYLAAQMTGVGIAVGNHAKEGGWMVDAPLACSPAEEAGILRGERILQIDEYHVEGTGLTKDEVTALLRGPTGSRVDLIIASTAAAGRKVEDGHPHTRHVLLERRPLPQPPVSQAFIRGDDGSEAEYIRIHYFTSETRKAVQRALLAGESLGVDGYIIDLRNNPGGVFEEAIAIASLFLDDDAPVAATVRTSGGFIDNKFQVGHLPKEVFYNLPGTVTHAPTFLLTNNATASAAEVLAGALSGNHRAVIIGEKTFGKGVVQYFFPMPNGGYDGGVKVTVAKYLGPQGYDISRNGGLPSDIPCSDYPHPGLPAAATDRCLATAMKRLSLRHDPIPAPHLYASTSRTAG